MSEQRTARLYLEDILESSEAIESYTAEIDFELFVNDRKTYSATIREFEIIGEAVGKLPAELKAKAPDTPWQDIKDFRNLLIHEYFGVDAQIVWHTLKHELPVLKKSVSDLLKTL